MRKIITKLGIITLNAIINTVPMLLGIGFAMNWHPLILTILLFGLIIIDTCLYALFKDIMED